MKVQEYLNNPSPIGGTAGNPRAVRESYDIHYGSMLRKLPKNQTETHFYYVRGVFYAHIKAPSESVDDFYYDVVLEFTPTSDTAPTFNTDDIRFFSNSPSFVYTYAHIYNTYDLLIKELCGKYEDEILKKKPDVRNPVRYVGYEKSTYFALKYFLNRFNDKFSIKKSASNDIAILIRSIKTNDDKKLERHLKEQAQKKEKEEQVKSKRQEARNKSIARKINANSDQSGVTVILPKKSSPSNNRVEKIKPTGRIPKRK